MTFASAEKLIQRFVPAAAGSKLQVRQVSLPGTGFEHRTTYAAGEMDLVITGAAGITVYASSRPG